MKYDVTVNWIKGYEVVVEAENQGEAEKIAIEQVKVFKLPPAYEDIDALASESNQ